MKRFALLLLLLSPPPSMAETPLQGLLQMLDYVGVDYPGAVAQGRVVNETEFQEMRDFAAAISVQVDKLRPPAGSDKLSAVARRLQARVEAKAEAAEISALVAQVTQQLLPHYQQSTVPRSAPDLAAAQNLYAEACASCHGLQGRGDGPLAVNMEPPPTDFTDDGRHAQRSLFGLYNTITLGVDETAMRGFASLPEQVRWELAFYVGQLAASRADIQAGEALWEEERRSAPISTLRQLTTLSIAEAGQRYGAEGRKLLSYLRSHPEQLFAEQASPLEFSRAQLQQSLQAYRQGDKDRAYRLAVSSYLEGFELMEAGVRAVAPQLLEPIEHAMLDLRGQIRQGVPAAELAHKVAEIDALLGEVQVALEKEQMSGLTAFTGSLVILLREGLEAILVIAALAAFLLKTGRPDAMRYLHIGWLAALGAGVLTWWVSTYLWAMGGATRELTEGVAALVAAAVLFYVGFWLHRKTQVSRWKQFIEENVNRTLSGATLWSLAGLSFITVYREAFETILFYQALWAQTGTAGKGMLMSGFVTAAAMLVVPAWLILRYSTRLPLRQFFAVTGVLVFVLAVVFAGKGIAAFQEAGKLPISSIEFPSIELLGIYPNLESIGVQLLMIVFAAVLLLWRRERPLAE